ncbi:unnamed protein product, partial [Effrenium voratum]
SCILAASVGMLRYRNTFIEWVAEKESPRVRCRSLPASRETSCQAEAMQQRVDGLAQRAAVAFWGTSTSPGSRGHPEHLDLWPALRALRLRALPQRQLPVLSFGARDEDQARPESKAAVGLLQRGPGPLVGAATTGGTLQEWSQGEDESTACGPAKTPEAFQPDACAQGLGRSEPTGLAQTQHRTAGGAHRAASTGGRRVQGGSQNAPKPCFGRRNMSHVQTHVCGE